MPDEMKNASSSEAAAPQNAGQQGNKEEQGKEHRTGSRLTVAGIAAFVGADVAIRVPLLYNLVTGKGREFSAGDNVANKAFKSTLAAFKQKNTVIAAAIGAATLGALGWVRGKEIEKPTDMFRHPLRSAAVLLGITDKEKETKGGEVSPVAKPESGIQDKQPVQNLMEMPVGMQTSENGSSKWQQKASDERAAAEQGGWKGIA